MAWEWVAPAGTAVVGLAGILATYLAGRRQASTALTATREQIRASLALGCQQVQGQLDLAREERRQRRAESAYPELLRALNEGDEWLWQLTAYLIAASDRLNSDVEVSGDLGEPAPEPVHVRQITEDTLLTAIWSPEVQGLVREWRRGIAVARVRSKMTGYLFDESDHALSLRAGMSDDAIAQRFTNFGEGVKAGRDKAMSAADGIRARVWHELNARPDPTPGSDLDVSPPDPLTARRSSSE